MTSRELPLAEWPRLAGTDLEASIAVLHPAWAKIVVVEEGDQILGAWIGIAMIHAEGAWIHPDHRKRAGVARALLRALKAALAPWDVTSVVVSPSSPSVRSLLARHGRPLPAEEYLLWLQ